MSIIRRWTGRLLRLARRGRVERAMDAEFRHHVECEIAEHVRRGMTPAEARRAALRDFGGIEAIKEQARDARGGRSIEDLLLDIRYAARVLRLNPAYTITAVLTFALGIGAVTAIFSLVYGILLRPLPYAAPDRLVVLWERNIPKHRDRNVVSMDNFEAWRDRARSVAPMAAVVPASITLAGNEAPERLVGAEVSPGYFATLGVTPALGRDFAPADARDGLAVILSDALWRRRFGADPSVVGRPVTMSGKAYTVAGVMPRGFEPPQLGWLGPQEFWVPLVPSPQTRSYGRFLIVIGRLAPASSIAQARGELEALAAQRAAEEKANDGWSASVTPLAEEISGDARASLLVLLGAVSLLLLMAVVNVATLTLAAMTRRARELAVRRAIGATDGRLFRQLFTQSALLGVLGACAGTAIAIPGVRLLVAMLPSDTPRPGAVAVDMPVLAVSSALALAATLLFGTVAAFRGRRAGPAASLAREADTGRTVAVTGGGALVAAEIALAAALGIMAALTARSFAHLTAVDLGFSGGGVVIGKVALPDTYATPESQRLFYERLVDRVRALPGVSAAGITSARPFNGLGPATTGRDAGRPPDPTQDPVVDVRLVDGGALDALGVSLARGTGFDARDASGPARVVISETLARTLWPGQDPLGRTLALEIYRGVQATVIGVVRDVHLFDARTAPRPLAYLPAARYPDRVRDVVVRVDGDPDAIVPALRTTVASMDPSLPLYAVTELATLVRRSTARDRLTMGLLAGFAIVALLLAAVGVFGVFAGDVAARRKEIGIRLALGAGGPSVVVSLLRRTAGRVAAGLAAGALVALAAGRGMQSLLFGVTATDPVSFLSVAAVVLVIASMATLVPALRALRRSPLEALRAP